jgi:hypothetical protein
MDIVEMRCAKPARQMLSKRHARLLRYEDRAGVGAEHGAAKNTDQIIDRTLSRYQPRCSYHSWEWRVEANPAHAARLRAANDNGRFVMRSANEGYEDNKFPKINIRRYSEFAAGPIR